MMFANLIILAGIVGSALAIISAENQFTSPAPKNNNLRQNFLVCQPITTKAELIDIINEPNGRILVPTNFPYAVNVLADAPANRRQESAGSESSNDLQSRFNSATKTESPFATTLDSTQEVLTTESPMVLEETSSKSSTLRSNEFTERQSSILNQLVNMLPSLQSMSQTLGGSPVNKTLNMTDSEIIQKIQSEVMAQMNTSSTTTASPNTQMPVVMPTEDARDQVTPSPKSFSAANSNTNTSLTSAEEEEHRKIFEEYFNSRQHHTASSLSSLLESLKNSVGLAHTKKPVVFETDKDDKVNGYDNNGNAYDNGKDFGKVEVSKPSDSVDYSYISPSHMNKLLEDHERIVAINKQHQELLEKLKLTALLPLNKPTLDKTHVVPVKTSANEYHGQDKNNYVNGNEYNLEKQNNYVSNQDYKEPLAKPLLNHHEDALAKLTPVSKHPLLNHQLFDLNKQNLANIPSHDLSKLTDASKFNHHDVSKVIESSKYPSNDVSKLSEALKHPAELSHEKVDLSKLHETVDLPKLTSTHLAKLQELSKQHEQLMKQHELLKQTVKPESSKLSLFDVSGHLSKLFNKDDVKDHSKILEHSKILDHGKVFDHNKIVNVKPEITLKVQTSTTPRPVLYSQGYQPQYQAQRPLQQNYRPQPQNYPQGPVGHYQQAGLVKPNYDFATNNGNGNYVPPVNNNHY